MQNTWKVSLMAKRFIRGLLGSCSSSDEVDPKKSFISIDEREDLPEKSMFLFLGERATFLFGVKEAVRARQAS